MKKLVLFVIAGAMVVNALAQQTLNLGGDISMLPQYESAKTPYLRSTGAKIDDVIAYMKSTCKFNSMRVRLFVDPDNSTDVTLVQDLEYVKNLGKRIKDAGLDFMVDFHYSDTWADPDHQDHSFRMERHLHQGTRRFGICLYETQLGIFERQWCRP